MCCLAEPDWDIELAEDSTWIPPLLKLHTSLYDPEQEFREIGVQYEGKTFWKLYGPDALHRRISKNTELYLLDGNDEIGVVAGGRIQALRVLNPNHNSERGAAIALELEGLFYFPCHDLQGNVIALLDSSGSLVEEYAYTAFGEESSHSQLNPWRFASKHTDETGLVFFGFRYYDPSSGRFITPDPSGFADSDLLPINQSS